ncbi:hypothetical protein PAXRUDRAFT_151506 [Paxillus rubicundulus Ve08.2h10]|uniref:Uncharacterized protein n=1 Tax=Paxillus rubicundulus Ve08.2h10 TaxID=930991 RepID=A0A0D0D299_9AGAM|nr:hypothetical protein PAXRUDRAFT_151506 [Paxillus rubicundulus Ve08.2h10]
MCSAFYSCLSLQDDFISKLKDHLLAWLYQHKFNGDKQWFSHIQHSHSHFIDNLNYVIESKTFQVNYTSYDICHHQDFMQPGNGCTIMMLSREDRPQVHPFWYVQVL